MFEGPLYRFFYCDHRDHHRAQEQTAETFAQLKKIRYDGWLTIESFGRLLPDLAAATKIWRDLFPSPEEVYTEGFKFMKRMTNS